MQIPIKAIYMRGGTSKGVFFKLSDLPTPCQVAGTARDELLLRIIGSPDPYGKQIDGMGNGSSSTSKVAILSQSKRADHDVNYLFGQVAIDKPMIDWSGNCGNLTAAIAAFAITNGLVDGSKIPQNGICSVRIWQENIKKTIIAHVPIADGQVQESGDFYLDGVAFAAAEIQVEFINPVDADGSLFPTGNVIDRLVVPDVGEFDVTMINAGIATVFLRASELNLTGTELQADINSNAEILAKLEKIRACAAVAMGLIDDISQAKNRQHTPKIAWVAAPATYTAASGQVVQKNDIDLLVRAMSMGQLHHAMMGTASVAIAAAAAIEGTLVNQAAGGGRLDSITFGHPSGTLSTGAKACHQNGKWLIESVSMSRSARRLMTGEVWIPKQILDDFNNSNS